jgi:hypothetical protein
MLTKLVGEALARKLKRERITVCLNCEKFVECESIGRLEECADFVEVDSEAWVIRKI